MNAADVARPFCNAPVEPTDPEGSDYVDGDDNPDGDDVSNNEVSNEISDVARGFSPGMSDGGSTIDDETDE